MLQGVSDERLALQRNLAASIIQVRSTSPNPTTIVTDLLQTYYCLFQSRKHFVQSRTSATVIQRWWRGVREHLAARKHQRTTQQQQQHADADIRPVVRRKSTNVVITDDQISRIIAEKQEQLRRIREERARLEAKLKAGTPASPPVVVPPPAVTSDSHKHAAVQPVMQAMAATAPVVLTLDMPASPVPSPHPAPSHAPMTEATTRITSSLAVNVKRPAMSVQPRPAAPPSIASSLANASTFKKILPSSTASLLGSLHAARTSTSVSRPAVDASKVNSLFTVPSATAGTTKRPMSSVSGIAKPTTQTAKPRDSNDDEFDRACRLNTLRNSNHSVRLVICEPASTEELERIMRLQCVKYAVMTSSPRRRPRINWNPDLVAKESMVTSPRRALRMKPARGVMRCKTTLSNALSASGPVTAMTQSAPQSPVIILPAKSKLYGIAPTFEM